MSPESVERVFSDCSGDFLETFRGSGAGGPGRHFRDFLGISGPKGPRDLCKGQAGLQGSLSGQLKWSWNCLIRFPVCVALEASRNRRMDLGGRNEL